MKIILASNNKNKLREIKEILGPFGLEVISQSQAGADIEVEENGLTFEENSALKARAIYDMFKMPVIADDSGLTVDYLDGAPGIYSARYAEPGKRCLKVLSQLENVPDEKRTAAFVCVICYIDEKGKEHFFRGECKGRISRAKRGENGFGYDPIFVYGDGEKTFAELSAEYKNKVSHRANALKKLSDYFKSERK
ncbi:MAG: RdgB/HAM1 family non-canonical purine NTP pyrophosphatase [Oscillospiraceae bacterium]